MKAAVSKDAEADSWQLQLASHGVCAHGWGNAMVLLSSGATEWEADGFVEKLRQDDLGARWKCWSESPALCKFV